jgi:hypothetical protein
MRSTAIRIGGGSFEQTLQSGLDGDRGPFAHKIINWAHRGWPGFPLPVIPFNPEDILKAVCDR